MTPPLFLADAAALAGDMVVLDGAEGRHAADVRRLTRGEPIAVGDGRGTMLTGVVAEVARGRILVAVQRRTSVPAAEPRLVVAQALAKGGRDTDAVESMTEAGVDAVLAWTAQRSVARWTDRTGERWRTTAREAAKRSRRAWVPEVAGPFATAELEARVAAAALAVVLHESADAMLADVSPPDDGEVVLVVGPEGGIAETELDQLAAAGARVCRLPGGVLRTSTAGVVALSVVQTCLQLRRS